MNRRRMAVLAGQGQHARRKAGARFFRFGKPADLRSRYDHGASQVIGNYNGWDFGVEDALGCMRVKPDIEFGGRGGVAFAEGSPHQHQPIDLFRQAGLAAEHQSEIGQRSKTTHQNRMVLCFLQGSAQKVRCGLRNRAPSGPLQSQGTIAAPNLGPIMRLPP